MADTGINNGIHNKTSPYFFLEDFITRPFILSFAILLSCVLPEKSNVPPAYNTSL
jgi:hypothetical protein